MESKKGDKIMRNLKKLMAIGLVAVMTLSLVACGGKETGKKGDDYNVKTEYRFKNV